MIGSPLTALRVAVFGTIMAGVAITDLQYYLIPDGFTVFGLIWVGVTSVAGVLIRRWRGLRDPYNALIGACVGAGAISIIGWLGEVVLKKEAMGFGDVTLMAVVGAAVGPGRTLLTVFFGASLGAVVFLVFVLPYTWVRSRRKQVPFEPPLVPFGVFLAPAAVVALLWGYRLIAWYLGRIGLCSMRTRHDAVESQAVNVRDHGRGPLGAFKLKGVPDACAVVITPIWTDIPVT